MPVGVNTGIQLLFLHSFGNCEWKLAKTTAVLLTSCFCLVWFVVFKMLSVSMVRFQSMYSNDPIANPHCRFVFSVLETEDRSIHIGKMWLIMCTFLPDILRAYLHVCLQTRCCNALRWGKQQEYVYVSSYSGSLSVLAGLDAMSSTRSLVRDCSVPQLLTPSYSRQVKSIVWLWIAAAEREHTAFLTTAAS